MKKHVWYLLMIMILYLGLTVFDQVFIFTDEFIYRSLSNEFSESFIEALITSGNRFGWLTYVIVPFIVVLKILFTTFCVTTGAILTGLSKFLSVHYDSNFTELKTEILTGGEHQSFSWLDKMPK